MVMLKNARTFQYGYPRKHECGQGSLQIGRDNAEKHAGNHHMEYGVKYKRIFHAPRKVYEIDEHEKISRYLQIGQPCSQRKPS